MDTHFSKEALKAQDGKKVPLTMYPGGPVIGEATMRYDSETGNLKAQCEVKDPRVKKLLQGGYQSSCLGDFSAG